MTHPIDGISAPVRGAAYGLYCAGASLPVGIVRLIFAVGYLIKYSLCTEQARARQEAQARVDAAQNGVVRAGQRVLNRAKNGAANLTRRLQGELTEGDRRVFWIAQAKRAFLEISIVGSWYQTYLDHRIPINKNGATSTLGLQELHDGLETEGFWS